MQPDRAAWIAVLEELEAGLTAVASDPGEQAEGDGPLISAWSAPDSLGPIPADLVERASRIISGQETRIERLTELRDAASRHLAAVRAVQAVGRSDASVYLDVIG